MKYFLTNIYVLVLVSVTAQIQSKLPQLIKKVDPSVVKIYTLDSKNDYQSQGSGVIISNDGICVSNYHVLIGAIKAIAITASGKKYEISKILDFSKQNDLIKFKLNIGNENTIPAIINSILPQKGIEVFAVGYPNGFKIQGESTATTGIISSFREDNGEKIIQTSTPFTHGSSGGGLFDDTGKLIGITSGTFADEVKDRHANLNKVIPVALVNKLNRNFNLTLSMFYEKIKNDENFIKGMLAYESRNFETATYFFRAHIKDFPEDATAWFRLGNAFNQLGRGSLNKEILNSAIECFDISISLDTNYYHPWGQAALVYSILGEISLAKYYAIKSYQIEPNVGFTNYVIGRIANGEGNYVQAIEFLSSAISKASDFDKSFSLHQWHLERAIAESLLKLDNQAENDYKTCLYLNSNNLDGYFNYAVFLENRDRKNEACNYFNILYNKNPNYRRGPDSIKQIIDEYCNN